MNRTLINLFFLCEDCESMNRAFALKDKLVRKGEDRAIINANFYEYIRLRHPLLRESALIQAVGADMIVVSARGTEAMPQVIQDWLDQAAALRSEKIVCAEYLGVPSPEKAAIFHRFTDKGASQCGTFLFSNLFPLAPTHVPAGENDLLE